MAKARTSLKAAKAEAINIWTGYHTTYAGRAIQRMAKEMQDAGECTDATAKALWAWGERVYWSQTMAEVWNGKTR
jgi:hypothetical protein